MVHALILVLLHSVVSFSFAEAQTGDSSSKITHTLIDQTAIKTHNQKDCELMVLMSLDRKEVRIMRIDPIKGTYNAYYFMKNPQYISRYGRSLILSEIVNTRGLKVKTVQSAMNFSDNQREVVLSVHLSDGSVVDKKVSVDADFFRDYAKQCLK